ncbi:MAG: hypothetical protein AAGC85_06925 [Bacteroidota bacterium]
MRLSITFSVIGEKTMSQKSSLKTTAVGLGSSLLSLAGICGGGVCAAACGLIWFAPIGSLLGISTAGVTAWMDGLLPFFIAISAVAFTASYYSLYKQPAENCCEEDPSTVLLPLVWSKRLFWIGLILTVGMYGYTLSGNSFQQEESTLSGESSCSSLAIEYPKESCQPGSSSVAK